MKKSILMSVVLAAFVLVVGVVTAIAADNGTDEAGATSNATTTTVAPEDPGRVDTTDGTAPMVQFGPLDEVLDDMVASGQLSQDLADEIRSRMADKIRGQFGSGPFGNGPGGVFEFRFGPGSGDGIPPSLDPNRLRDYLSDPNGPLGDLPDLMQQFLEDGNLTPEERQQLQDQLQQQFGDQFGENSPFPFGPFGSRDDTNPDPNRPSI